MSFLWNKTTPVIKITDTNPPIDETFQMIDKPFQTRSKVVHSDNESEDSFDSMPSLASPRASPPTTPSINVRRIKDPRLNPVSRVPTEDSMPGLVSDAYNSSETEDESSDDEHINEPVPEPVKLIRPSAQTLEHLRDGYYDITYESGDRYIGQMVDGYCHGSGRYVYSSKTGHPDVKEGRFEEDDFVEGVFVGDSMTLRGTFSLADDDDDCLDGENCTIEYHTGIVFHGKVEMDEPVSGRWTIPAGTTAEFEGYEGTLSHNGTEFVLDFYDSAPFYSVSSKNFDCVDLCFDDSESVRIEFNDECTFEGVVTENNNDPADFMVSTVARPENWGHYQTVLWLMSTVPNFPIPFFDAVQERELTLRQMAQFRPVHYRLVNLDKIQSLQMNDHITRLYKITDSQ